MKITRGHHRDAFMTVVGVDNHARTISQMGKYRLGACPMRSKWSVN